MTQAKSSRSQWEPEVVASLTRANWPWLEKLDLHIYDRFSDDICKEIAKGNWPKL